MEANHRPSVLYHYFRDSKGQPRIVLARVIQPDGQVGYGWSILGLMDQFHSKDYVIETSEGQTCYRGGNRIARERAACAIGNPKRGVQVADGVWRYKRRIYHPHAIDSIIATNAQCLLDLNYHDTTTMLPFAMQPPREKEGV